MAVIHNFYLKRGDGTTAAECLFGRECPDLFQWVLEMACHESEYVALSQMLTKEV
jgi:hypothetical protein